jgi:hypothetical protein
LCQKKAKERWYLEIMAAEIEEQVRTELGKEELKVGLRLPPGMKTVE